MCTLPRLLLFGLLTMCVMHLASATINVHSPAALERLFNLDQTKENGDKMDLFDVLLEDIIPTWFGQRPNNENGTRSEFKDYALKDESNDDALRLTGQQLLARSGYKFQTYDALAEDGYITQLTHVINPLADPTCLRQPPVLMEHGGSIDPTAYLVASSIQHFPEKYPREPEDGPWRSWNRSLAFYLANSGFDVWLAETRGSNDLNKRHIKSKTFRSFIEGNLKNGNLTLMEQVKEVVGSLQFWSFSQDDIIAHELRSHIDAVLNLTRSTKLNMMTFSLSTPTSLAFLGTRPDYAHKVHGYVSMAPIISGEGTSKFIKLVFQTLCPLLPDEVGTLLLTDMLFTQPARELFVLISRNKYSRYVIFKTMSTMLMGASAKWQTLLDLNLVGHLFRQLSFKEFKQMCQQMSKNKLQKFDYGPVKNKILYGSLHPPVYNISDLQIKDWIVVSGSNDALSTPQVIDHLMSIVNPKPIAHVVAPNFNHLDLFAGWENDIYVNEPIKRYFERMTHVPGEELKSIGANSASGARNLDLAALLTQNSFVHLINDTKLIGNAAGVAKTLTDKLLPGAGGNKSNNPITGLGGGLGAILGAATGSGGGAGSGNHEGVSKLSKLDPTRIIETITKSIQTVLSSLKGDGNGLGKLPRNLLKSLKVIQY